MRTLRDALGEAMRSAAVPLTAEVTPWMEAETRDGWLYKADRLLTIAAKLGVSITLTEPEKDT